MLSLFPRWGWRAATITATTPNWTTSARSLDGTFEIIQNNVENRRLSCVSGAGRHVAILKWMAVTVNTYYVNIGIYRSTAVTDREPLCLWPAFRSHYTLGTRQDFKCHSPCLFIFCLTPHCISIGFYECSWKEHIGESDKICESLVLQMAAAKVTRASECVDVCALILSRYDTHPPSAPCQVMNVNLLEGDKVTFEDVGHHENAMLANESILMRGLVVRSHSNQISVHLHSQRPRMGSVLLHYQGEWKLRIERGDTRADYRHILDDIESWEMPLTPNTIKCSFSARFWIVWRFIFTDLIS